MSATTYTYYPGCSASGLGRGFTESLDAVFRHLGVGLEDLEDWNCCGTSAWTSVDQDQAFALSARNLALAEDRAPDGGPVDLVASCTGCYRSLLHAERALATPGPTATKIGDALATIGLRYEGRARVRHPLDILVNEIGLDAIAEAVVRPLTGLKVASYYGCLLVRPFATFDDAHDPMSMDKLVETVGAEPIRWPLKTRCCGASVYCGGAAADTMPDATMQLSFALLREATERGADTVATICPLCQFNLEAFQGPMARRFGRRLDMPVVFISQLLGVAFGIDEERLGIRRLRRWYVPEREPATAGGGVHA